MIYFAYGSNMNPDRMIERGILFSNRQRGVLKGYQLRFNKVSYKNPINGFANIVKDETSVVEGILYEVSNYEIQLLDIYEGYPNHYTRIKIKVQSQSNESVEAIAYIAHPDKIREGLKPSENYIKHLLLAKDYLSKQYYYMIEGYNGQ